MKKQTILQRLIGTLVTIFHRFIRLFRSRNKKLSFLDVLAEYINKEIRENDLAASTVKKYHCQQFNIELFFKKHHIQNLTCDDLRVKHMESLKLWLHTHLDSCALSHSARHVELCKRGMKYAMLMEYATINRIDAIDSKREKVKDVVCLEQEELKRLMLATFKTSIYQEVRDLYLFQAFTGLSYSDIYVFDIITDNEGDPWIHNRREKTDKPFYVPLLEPARILLNIYNNQLPQLTNQAYNRVLKELCAQIGIKKHLTTHTARKTFANIMADEGYSIEWICSVMGQSSIKVTERHYLRSNRHRLKAEHERIQASKNAA